MMLCQGDNLLPVYIQPRHARAADEVLSLLVKSGASTQLSPEDWAAFRDLCDEIREAATPKTVFIRAVLEGRPARKEQPSRSSVSIWNATPIGHLWSRTIRRAWRFLIFLQP